MRRYFFHIRSHDGRLIRDQEGDLLASPRAAIEWGRESALEIRDGLKGVWRYAAFEIEDEDRAPVATLPLLTGRRRRLASPAAAPLAEAA